MDDIEQRPLVDCAALLEGLPLPATLIDAGGIVVDVNQAFLDLARRYGREIRKEDRIGHPVAAFAETAEERRRFGAFVEELLRSGEARHSEWSYVDPRGRQAFWNIHANAFRDAAGRVAGALILREEVTQKIRHERQQAVLSRVRDAVLKMQRGDDITGVLEAIRQGMEALGTRFAECEINGLDPSSEPPFVYVYTLNPQKEWQKKAGKGRGDDLIRRIWRAGAPCYRPDLAQEDIHGEREYIERIYGHPVRSVLDIPFAQGTLALNSPEPNAFTEEEIAFLQALTGALGIGFQRLFDFRRLERSEARYRALVETPDLVVALMDLDGRYLYVSPQVEYMSGYSAAEFYADHQTGRQLVHPDDVGHSGRMIQQVARTGEIARWEFRWRGKGQTDYRWASEAIFPVRDDRGEIIALQAILQDITEQKRAEEAYRTLVEQSPVGISIWQNSRIIFANQAEERLTGYGRDELVALAAGELVRIVHPEDRWALGYFEKRLRGEPIPDSYELRLIHKTGAVRWVSRNVRCIQFQGNPAVQVMDMDITAHKRMEQELIRLERLRVAGELSAGVSHNLNNILTCVLGPAQLLKRKIGDPDLLLEIDTILSSARRARDLVHLLHISVKGESDTPLQAVPVDPLVQEAVRVARPCWKDEAEARGASIEVVTRLKAVSAIRGAASGLHTILVNLLFNAVDAMPEGGTITIETRETAEGVQLIFADTGIGMDEETRKRVFEPFFTTKMDVGSGLGLSTVWGIVAGWGGKVEVESAPGQGATFSFLFPVYSAAVQGEEAGS